VDLGGFSAPTPINTDFPDTILIYNDFEIAAHDVDGDG
jgi:hypothetical protein